MGIQIFGYPTNFCDDTEVLFFEKEILEFERSACYIDYGELINETTRKSKKKSIYFNTCI